MQVVTTWTKEKLGSCWTQTTSNRNELDEEVVPALDQHFTVVCINGVPKKRYQSTLYKLVVKYDKDQFQFRCDGPLLPRSSLKQVSQILDAFAAIPKGKLEEGLNANRDKAKAEMFESPKQFASYVKNWIKVLKVIKKARKGLAIDRHKTINIIRD